MNRGEFSQILAVVTGTIGAITDGMQYGWTAPVIPILQRNDTPIAITHEDIVWLENAYMLGGLAGLGVTIFIVDKFGRKMSILMAAVLHLIAWVLIPVASTVGVLFAAKFIAGLAGDVGFVAAPMYIGEIADKRIRGFLGSMIVIMMMLGILIIYVVAPYVSLAISSSVGAAIVTFQLMTFSFMPESPYYLIVKGKHRKALQSLQRLRARDDVHKELEEIRLAVERQQSEKGRPIDLLKIKSNRKALLIVTSLNAFQHFSSISIMLMNVHSILGDGYFSANTSAIIVSVIMLVACMAGSLIVDRFGRKVLLISSSVLTGISLFILSTYFAVENAGMEVTEFNWIPLASVLLYSVAFKCGLGMVPLVSTGELFPTSVKAMGMTLSDAFYVIFAIISINIYQGLTDLYGKHVPFYIFAASCFLAALFVYFYIPETKGKTLEEIQFILKGESFDRSKRQYEMVAVSS
ncbi:facilitated trehalose transporter Tret1 [Agrilus planipennis]|uniref:Facilitated trehalose transporter Tret1 n=1 Tax=Agrilus planipennis TaxID=224129 RepID=A0A1W4X513_AGRPL|nr:facilitated trehalose transporter Tret1 [Agrilus planipennis]